MAADSSADSASIFASMNNPEVLREAADEIAKMMETPGWKILAEGFAQRRRNALEDLAEVDPFDNRTIQRLQADVKLYEYLLQDAETILHECNYMDGAEQAQREIDGQVEE